MYNLIVLWEKASKGDNESILAIVEKFDPLIKKYTQTSHIKS
jgi:hypothetical protein